MADGLVLDRLERARSAILAQLAERDRDFPGLIPEFPWTRACKAMSYVLNLPTSDLRSVRLHCDLFLGTQTGHYLFADMLPASPLLDTYRWLGEGIDPAFWAEEPVIPALGHSMGRDIEGHTVNDVTVDLQRYVCNLLRLGVNEGDHVCEIGAGYGGLAHAILRARHVRYTIIDLPETLIFSACFLSEHFAEKRVYVYRPGDFPDQMAGADLVFLPNYRADWLEPCDVAVNTVSFPEMSRTALTTYLDLLSSRLKPDGYLMSVNYYGVRNDDLGVPDFLDREFRVWPSAKVFSERPGYRTDINFRPTLVCTHRNAKPAMVTLRDIILHERTEVRTR